MYRKAQVFVPFEVLDGVEIFSGMFVWKGRVRSEREAFMRAELAFAKEQGNTKIDARIVWSGRRVMWREGAPKARWDGKEWRLV
jgi:hypothetical protein